MACATKGKKELPALTLENSNQNTTQKPLVKQLEKDGATPMHAPPTPGSVHVNCTIDR